MITLFEEMEYKGEEHGRKLIKKCEERIYKKKTMMRANEKGNVKGYEL